MHYVQYIQESTCRTCTVGCFSKTEPSRYSSYQVYKGDRAMKGTRYRAPKHHVQIGTGKFRYDVRADDACYTDSSSSSSSPREKTGARAFLCVCTFRIVESLRYLTRRSQTMAACVRSSSLLLFIKHASPKLCQAQHVCTQGSSVRSCKQTRVRGGGERAPERHTISGSATGPNVVRVST